MSHRASPLVVLATLILFVGTSSAAYLTTSPPKTSTGFNLSGPFTICEFFRPDLKELVKVEVDSTAFEGGNPITGPHQVKLTGTAVCGIPDSDGVLRTFGFFTVKDVTFGCVTRTTTGNTITYAEKFSDLDKFTTKCPNGAEPVSGSFTGLASPPPVVTNMAKFNMMLTYCTGGTPEQIPAPGGIAECDLEVGIQPGVNKNFFEKRVCPKEPSTGRTEDGQIFAFKEFAVNGEFRPGSISACYCHSDFDGGAITCGQGNTGERITTTTAGANTCVFDWQKTGNEAGDTINFSGSPSQVNAAIYDTPECPVADIDTKTVRVCNDVVPRQFKIATDQGKLALTFQITEGDCAQSLQGLELDLGEVRLIYATGAFKDNTRFVGADDVIVVGK